MYVGENITETSSPVSFTIMPTVTTASTLAMATTISGIVIIITYLCMKI